MSKLSNLISEYNRLKIETDNEKFGVKSYENSIVQYSSIRNEITKNPEQSFKFQPENIIR